MASVMLGVIRSCASQKLAPDGRFGRVERMKATGFTGTVSFDGEWVEIDHDTRAHIPGLMGKAPGLKTMVNATALKGFIRIPISRIVAVNFKKATGRVAALQGFISFRVEGSDSRIDNRSHFMDANHRDEQRVMFFPQQNTEFKAVADAIHQALGESTRQSAPPSQVTVTAVPASGQSVVGVADELRKLNDLRNEGVISDDEFAMQKARLLGIATVSSPVERLEPTLTSDEVDEIVSPPEPPADAEDTAPSQEFSCSQCQHSFVSEEKLALHTKNFHTVS